MYEEVRYSRHDQLNGDTRLTSICFVKTLFNTLMPAYASGGKTDGTFGFTVIAKAIIQIIFLHIAYSVFNKS